MYDGPYQQINNFLPLTTMGIAFLIGFYGIIGVVAVLTVYILDQPVVWNFVKWCFPITTSFPITPFPNSNPMHWEWTTWIPNVTSAPADYTAIKAFLQEQLPSYRDRTLFLWKLRLATLPRAQRAPAITPVWQWIGDANTGKTTMLNVVRAAFDGNVVTFECVDDVERSVVQLQQSQICAIVSENLEATDRDIDYLFSLSNSGVIRPMFIVIKIGTATPDDLYNPTVATTQFKTVFTRETARPQDFERLGKELKGYLGDRKLWE